MSNFLAKCERQTSKDFFLHRFCQPDAIMPSMRQSICASSETAVTQPVTWHVVRATCRRKPGGHGEQESGIMIHWQAFIPIDDPNFSCLKTPSVPKSHLHTACKFQFASAETLSSPSEWEPISLFAQGAPPMRPVCCCRVGYKCTGRCLVPKATDLH